MIHVLAFHFNSRQDETLSPDAIPGALAAGAFLWVDIDCSPCQAATPDCGDCRATLADLQLNSEVIEAVMGPDQEGRYDIHPDCLHFAVSEGRLQEGRLASAHVDIVLAAKCLVTYRRGHAEFPKQMRRTCREDFQKFAKSPGFLLYEIGDYLIEGYRRTLRTFSSAVEQTQLKLFADVDDAIFRQVAALTQDLLMFRKHVLAARELMHELATRRSPFVSETTQPALEHMAGTIERLGNDLTTEREVLNETLNLYMGMVSHRTNKVVNRLTLISMVFLPLSFLCGVYGMNFEVIPELAWRHGYLYFWVLVASLSALLLFLMKRRRWL